ncbi:MAG: AraC family transcriptional regulator [Myxococcota bacterium]
MAAPQGTDGLTCSVRAISPLVRLFERRGRSTAPLLEAAGLESARVSDPDLRLPASGFLSAWAWAEEHSGDPHLGLHAAEAVDLDHTALLAYLAASSATAREAYQRATRFTRIVADFLGFDLVDEKGRALFRIVTPPGIVLPRAYAEFTVATMARISPRILGEGRELEAWLARPAPDDRREHDRVLGIPIRFDAPVYGACVRAADLDLRLPRADADLAALLERQAQEALDRLPADASTTAAVRRVIETLLPRGQAGLESVASALGLGARTLRRRLSAEGTSHRRLLQQVRIERATRALEAGERSIGEVAFLVGYADASAFCKAFRRWTGHSPRAHRGRTHATLPASPGPRDVRP